LKTILNARIYLCESDRLKPKTVLSEQKNNKQLSFPFVVWLHSPPSGQNRRKSSIFWTKKKASGYSL